MILSSASALPVTFGPHEADWWMVAVTALGMLGTVTAAVFAIVSARQARTIAQASEAARVADAERRDREQYELAVRSATVDLLRALGQYNVEHDVATKDGKPVPSLFSVVGSLQAFGLILSEEDLPAFRVFWRWMNVAQKDGERRRALIRRLMNGIRQWKRGEVSLESMLDSVAELEAESGVARPAGF